MSEPVSRRRFLGAAGLGLGGLVAAGAGIEALRSSDGSEVSPGSDIEPFYAEHQGGIVTAPQRNVRFAAFDVYGDDRADLVDLLRRWSALAAALSHGDPPPADSGEATGLGPQRLTFTIGFGPSLFGLPGQSTNRFGLAAQRPASLTDLPQFANDELVPSRSGGDLGLQVCADDPAVAFHALRTLARAARDTARVRWMQAGAGSASVLQSGAPTPRNLLGQPDGTNNLRVDDQEGLRDHVWLANADEPAWLRGGTFLVMRRIRMQLETWDRVPVDQQERSLGRHRDSGAPLGKSREHDEVDLEARDGHGQPVIAADAHIRLASPKTIGGVRMLRRAYNFDDGIDALGTLDAGLLFIAFVRDPMRQFVPLQRRLSESDALHQFLRHTASALFACPPGATPGGYVGESLLG